MNYQIITDENVLNEFIEWLPRLGENEYYYGCLFARSKYAKNEDGSNRFPHIKTDKAQLKRFTASKKADLIGKLRQLETAIGTYITKDGEPIPQEALAVYITPNPRNQMAAMFNLMKRLVDIQICDGTNYNIHQEALSAIQRSKSRTVYVDFDIDSSGVELEESIQYIRTCVNKAACTWLQTRGGVHVLIDPIRVDPLFTKTWYKNIQSLKTVDKDSGNDTMIPVPGTYQGGFTPHFYTPSE